MTRRFSRLELTFLDKDSPGRPSSENLFVDVVLGEDDRIVGKWELYGRWTENNTEGSALTYPMTIKQDGEVRFGPDDGYSTNLRERTLKLGDLATFWGDTDRGESDGLEWTYKVVRSIDLLTAS